MSAELELYFHPFSSFCQKVLVALYENATPFEPCVIDLGNAESAERLRAIWPIGKFPVLRDHTRNRTIAESTIIIEYLCEHYPGKTPLVPKDADLALRTRMSDRFYDLYVEVPMQKIVGDRLRPADKRDPYGVEEARRVLRTAYDLVEQEMRTRMWATGDQFTMADCAAAPAMYYANLVMPLGARYPSATAYLDRLMERPSFARAVEEAAPYRSLFPKES